MLLPRKAPILRSHPSASFSIDPKFLMPKMSVFLPSLGGFDCITNRLDITPDATHGIITNNQYGKAFSYTGAAWGNGWNITNGSTGEAWLIILAAGAGNSYVLGDYDAGFYTSGSFPGLVGAQASAGLRAVSTYTVNRGDAVYARWTNPDTNGFDSKFITKNEILTWGGGWGNWKMSKGMDQVGTEITLAIRWQQPYYPSDKTAQELCINPWQIFNANRYVKYFLSPPPVPKTDTRVGGVFGIRSTKSPTQFTTGIKVNNKHTLAKGLRYALFNTGNGYVYNAVKGKYANIVGGDDYILGTNSSSQYKKNDANTIFSTGTTQGPYINIAEAGHTVKLNSSWSIFQSIKLIGWNGNSRTTYLWQTQGYVPGYPYYDYDSLSISAPIYSNTSTIFNNVQGNNIGGYLNGISNTDVPLTEYKYLASHPSSGSWYFFHKTNNVETLTGEGVANQTRGAHDFWVYSSIDFDMGTTLIWDRAITTPNDIATYQSLYFDIYFWDLFTLR